MTMTTTPRPPTTPPPTPPPTRGSRSAPQQPIRLTLLDAMRDAALFGTRFDGPSSGPMAVLCGGPLRTDRRPLGHGPPGDPALVLGRTRLPTEPAHEAWLIIGRRGGKSRFAALVAVFLACFRDYRPLLAPGERGVLMVIAADRQQARVVHQYVSGLLHAVPMLEVLITHETNEAIALTTRVTIEIHTASFRAVRGYTVVAAICDEVAVLADRWRRQPRPGDPPSLAAGHGHRARGAAPRHLEPVCSARRIVAGLPQALRPGQQVP